MSTPSVPVDPVADDGEQVVARLRPHARRLFWSAVALVVIIALIAYFGGNLPEQWQNLLLLGGGSALIGLIVVVPYIIWLGRHYIITTRRLVIRRGFVTRIRQELLHSRGYDVTVRQSPLQRMFGSGDVLVNTGLDLPIALKDVPDALLVSETLQDLFERSANPIAARRQFEESVATGSMTTYTTSFPSP